MRCRLSDIPFWVEHGVDPDKTKDNFGRKLINNVYDPYNKSRDECFAAIKYLVEHGVDVNYKAPMYNIHTGLGSEWTILHHAARCGDTELVQYLLDHGANPKIKAQGETPLDIAMKYNCQECVKLLLKYT